MKASDLFTDQLRLCGPPRIETRVVLAPADRRDVVEQSVQPDVYHAAAVDRNAPIEARSRDRQIVEALVENRHHFVIDAARLDPLWVRKVMLQQPIPIGGEPKEPVVFRYPLHLAAARGAATVDQFRFEPKRLVVDAVPALVLTEIHVAAGPQSFEDAPNLFDVAGFRRSNEIVVAHVVCGKQLLPTRHQFVAPFLRRLAGSRRSVGDFLAVLVGPRQEERWTKRACGARQYVRDDRRVSVADMRASADVVDRRRDVIGAFHRLHCCFSGVFWAAFRAAAAA